MAERKIKNNLEYISRYNSENTINVAFRLNVKTDADLISYLDALDEPKATYIKRLIRADMESRKS